MTNTTESRETTADRIAQRASRDRHLTRSIRRAIARLEQRHGVVFLSRKVDSENTWFGVVGPEAARAFAALADVLEAHSS